MHPGVATMVASSGSVLGWVISVAIEVVIVVWIYYIALRKGRHPIGWLILGLFFSIIALIVILLLPSKRTTESA